MIAIGEQTTALLHVYPRTIFSLLLLLLVFLFIFSLLGMQFFGGDFPTDVNGHPQRPNFDNIWMATLSVFQCLTGEDWNDVMYTSIDAKGGINSAGAAYVVGSNYANTTHLISYQLRHPHHLFSCTRASVPLTRHLHPRYALYYLCLIIIGGYVVLNIFLAIAVDSLASLKDVMAELKAVR